MQLFFIILFRFFTGISASEAPEDTFPETFYYGELYDGEGASREEFEKEPANNSKAVFEDPDCDSCFIEADFSLPFPFPIPSPQWFPPPHPFCGYGASNVCHTINGNLCYSFILNYPFMTNWISSCIEIWPIFRSCTQLSVSVPISSGCYPIGAPCLCGFPGYYEAGHIF